MVFGDPRSLELRSRLERIAPSDAPVLVTGETGTGKELVAREVHARSGRADKPFVAVNAGAFSEQLIESELFGHEKGAFTGAHTSQVGWFEAADGGTLFLDEIGDLPLALQVKLLRVLSTGEVTRLGSRSATRVNVRVIAATNVDLQLAMGARRFREDLYYRLSVTSLALPPLRERPGDILPLAAHFLGRHAARLGRGSVHIGPSAAAALLRHSWPGNIRELENTVHQGLLVCAGNELGASDLGLTPVELVHGAPGGEASAWTLLERTLRQLVPLGVPALHARVESALLATAFEYSGQNQLETARLLGLSRHVVRARLIEHGHLPGPLRRGVEVSSAAAPPASAEEPPLQASPPLHVPPLLQVPRLSQGSPSRGLLRVGFQKLGLLMLVKAYGGLDEALGSLNVEIAWREYAGGIQIVDALRQGELDVGVVGDCPAVYAQAENVPVVYVAAEPPARRGAAALLVPRWSSARSVSELRGKRVAVNRAAQAHYLLMLALEEAGVSPSELDIVFEPPERALRAFERGEIDAWGIWDPWLSSARLDLGARVLRDTTGLFESSVYYLARREFAERKPELVREFCAQLGIAARRVESDPGRAARLVAPLLGLSPLALAASLDRELCGVAITPAQLVAQQRIADHCVRLQMIPRAVSVAAAQWSHTRVG
jgi:aliphatic sulfonates family ABC transporter substrate-binding protein